MCSIFNFPIFEFAPMILIVLSEKRFLFSEKIAEFAIILELNDYSDCLKLGNEIATVRISEFFIIMLQCDNSDATKVQK